MSIAKRKPIGLAFPNLNSTLACYDSTMQSIFMYCASKSDLEVLKSNNKDTEAAKKMAVLMHELRHYIDQISTLWGQNNILLFQGSAASVIKKDEYDMQAIVDYMREEYRVKQEQYYQEEYKQASFNGKPWIMGYSAGLKFASDGSVDENRPIIFARFYTENNEPICRIPITIASLLEVSAMSVEIDFRMSHIGNTTGEDAKFHGKIYGDDLLKDLVYNQQLSLYNIAAHVVANSFHIKYIEEAYWLASKIATLTLNMPNEYLSLITIPARLTKDKTIEARVKQAIINGDAGAVFLALTLNYSEKFNEGDKYDLGHLLKSNSLPNEDDFKKLVNDKFLFTTASALDSKHRDFMPNYYINLLVGGASVFKDRGLDGGDEKDTTILVKHKMYPIIFFEDSDIPEPNPGTIKDVATEWDNSPAFRYHYLWALRKKQVDFFEIRGL